MTHGERLDTLRSKLHLAGIGLRRRKPGEGIVDMLDVAECERARMARDPAYDGRFFSGVRTTGVYCRPVSAAPQSSALRG